MIKLPLRVFTIIPFVLQVLGATGLVGYLSFKNGQQATEKLAHQLILKAGDRTQLELTSYLEVLPFTSRNISEDARFGKLNLNDLKNIESYLFQQVNWSERVTQISIGNQRGELQVMLRFPDLKLLTTDPNYPGQLLDYQLNERGARTKLNRTFKFSNLQERPWYKAAAVAQELVWVPIFSLGDASALSLNVSSPIYDPQTRELLGVVSTGFNLSLLDRLLQQSSVSPASRTFIMERNGLLVADSTQEAPFRRIEASGKTELKQIEALNASDPLIQATSQYLYRQFGDFSQIRDRYSSHFRLPPTTRFSPGERQFIEVVPYQDTPGLDWLIVVVVPESEFLAEIHEHTYTTVLLCALAAFVTAGLGIRTARWITDPILELNTTARSIAQGELNEPIADSAKIQRFQEIYELANSFQAMTHQLQASLQALRAANTNLEMQVVQRTYELRQANLDLQQELVKRQQVEAAIAQSEERLQLALEASGDGVWDWNILTGEVYFSPRYLEILGYAPDELLQEFGTWEQLVHPDDLPWVRELLDAHLQNSAVPYSFDYRLRTRLGEWKWTANYGKVVVRDAEGHPLRMSGIHRDIHARKQLELALQRSEAKLKDIFDSAIATSIVSFRVFANRGWQYEYQSPGCEALYGYTAQEIMADPDLWMSKVFAEDRETVLFPLFDAIFAEQTLTIEFRFWHKSGELRWISATYTSRYESSDNCWMVTGVSTDISDRKFAELALQESEAKFRQLAENIQQVFFLISQTGEMLYISPAYERIWRRSCASLYANPRSWLESVHPEDFNRTCEALNYQIQNGQEFNETYRIVQPDGTIRWIAVRSFPVLNEQQEFYRFVGIAEDITERKYAEERLQQSESQLNTIVTHISDGILILNRNGAICFANPAATRMMGCDLLGQNWGIPIGETAEIDLPQAEGEPKTLEMRSVTTQWLGDLAYVVAIRDISDRKQAEAALRQSEASLQAFVQAIPDLIIRTKRDGTRLAFSPGNFKMLGGSEIGGNLKDVLPHHLAQQRLYYIQQALETGELQLYEYQIEVDGNLQYEEARVFPSGADEVFIVVRDISDRTFAEQALRKNQALLLEAQQTARIGNWEFDLATQKITWTDELFEVLQRDRSLGEPDYQENLNLYYPGDRERLHQAVTRAVETGEPYKLTLRTAAPLADGSIQYLEAIGRVETNSLGQPIRLYGTGQDVTERVQMELELRSTRDRLHFLLTASPAIIFSCKPDGDYAATFTSDNIKDILGYDAQSFLADPRSWIDRLHPEDRDRVLGAVPQLLQQEQFSQEYRLQHADGSYRWLFQQMRAIRDELGNPMEIVGYAVDITQRKQTELELLKSGNLREAIFNESTDALFLVDPTTLLTVDCNAQAIEIFEASNREELIGIAGETLHKHPLTPEQMDDLIAQIARYGFWSQEFEYVTKTGRVFWGNFAVKQIHLAEGNAIDLVRITDVTNRKQGELELQQAKTQAEMANQAKSVFLANMSHELRTPLNAILGFTQVMARDRSLNARHQESLQIIHHSGEHLLNLISDILDFSKIEAGRVALEESSVNAIALIQSMREMFYQRIQTQSLQFHLEIAPNVPPYLILDAKKLRQVLINLLGNAVKFTPQGSITLRVACEPSASDPQVCHLSCTVEDTGIGIPTSDLETIFEPFIQARSQDSVHPGTGLGLTISRRFIRLMGGDIAVRSSPGEGSQFSFSIPVRLAEPVEEAIATPLRRVVGLAANQPQYRVLVVDDNWENRHLLAQVMAQIGLEVRHASTGDEAVAWAQSWHPHLIWMDIRMPGKDGYTATQEIRMMDLEPIPVIIALTAQASLSERDRALSSGCNDYVSKPFQQEMLFAKMAEYLTIEYRYEGEPVVQDVSCVSVLQPTDLQVMSPEWRSQLYQAALHCDDEEILMLVQQVPAEYQAMRGALEKLARDFQFRQIQQLVSTNSTETPEAP
ncbi:PAS domain-containing protein [Kamptonema cortianum]|nr:PAS domain-containing protein [Kamptonema cortianum]